MAGLGTRFLPATKASPKEMLPIVDKPLIQFAVEEAIEAGITHLVFVTGRLKRSIEDHFDRAVELEQELEAKKKYDLLQAAREILPSGVTCIYIRQSEPLGLGHAVLCARPVIGDEPFAVILADDLIDSESQGCLSQFVKIWEQHRVSVLGVQQIRPEESENYGVVAVDDPHSRVARVQSIVEKPAPEAAPSNLGVVGRYILSPAIFDKLENTAAGTGGEVQLTDAIASLLPEEKVIAAQFDGTRYDCGSKLGYLMATVAFGLKHPDAAVRKGLASYLAQIHSQGVNMETPRARS